MEWEIRRTDNGYYVRAWLDDESFSTVHEGEPAEALCNLLYEHFENVFQSKLEPGLVIRRSEKGREAEDDEIVCPAIAALTDVPEEQREPIRRCLELFLGYDPLPVLSDAPITACVGSD